MCTFSLPKTPRSPEPPDWSAARDELRDLLTTVGWPADLIWDAELALHELFVNAWKHGGSPAPVVVVLLLADRALRILRVSVADESPTLPEQRTAVPDPYELSGRGLHLVRSLTHRFGAAPRKHGGKVVWFELETVA
ncbi:ATP-binding protein [Kitasatospora kifunensis]|uniref:Anti-sigma regulatory factor (Ser/Thr protein kinase) n=1 Tax=Kitasatospora kifunensis TaxID=58351 RepID=A0A7W7R8V9_KITKI|nr:ATP-binding protein [Kitasatospora kifunensis]MBB4927454.1 anti-sigma regulatory factor (Ser/Thr protein kinase) [Kitasatospora kifunensis]